MEYDLIIIGAGPAGYVAAIRAGQIGLKTALVEKEHLGGMCLNWGCIPVKSLLESAKFYHRLEEASRHGIEGINLNALSFNWQTACERAARIISTLSGGIGKLLKKNGVHLIEGTARIITPTSIEVGGKKIEGSRIIIATGSKPAPFEFDLPKSMLLEIKEMFRRKSLPDSITVYGEGPNVLELAQLLAMTGKSISVVCPAERIIDMADPYVAAFAERKLIQNGIKVFLKSEITGRYENGILVGDEKVPTGIVLNSTKRAATIPQIEFELNMDRGYIVTDNYFRTSEPTIFATGDVNGRSILAHVASDQGIRAVNYIGGIRSFEDTDKIPLNIYSNPEIAQVGLTEPQIKARGIEYKVSEFPLQANGKALAEGNTEGFIRLISDKKFGEVLGVQIVAAHATDMIAEASAIMAMEGTIYDMANVLHAHPTVSEIYTEAGLAAVDKPIHI